MEVENYFFLRGVSPQKYCEYSLPAWLVRVLFNNNVVTVLDYGCGYGQTLKALSQAGLNAKGFDVSSNAISVCHDQGLIAYTAEEDIECAYYDAVIMMHVLEHIEKDQMIETLKKVKRYLKPGGFLVLAVPNAQSNTGPYWRYEDFTHNWLFTSGSLGFILKAAGASNIQFLDVDCCEGLGVFYRLIRKIGLKWYKLNRHFWNRITASSYHHESIDIFSYEIKCAVHFQK